MKLSDIEIGGRAVIVKVAGHGGFRRRIVEMGFIKGKVVEVLNRAPLGDPIEYAVMGYNVSLRRSEAERIEVITVEEAERIVRLQSTYYRLHITDNRVQSAENGFAILEEEIRQVALDRRKEIQVALVGNPNAGKTSLFNVISGAHEKVGNYSGVTVDAKETEFEYRGYKIRLVDLPGTYSLSAYSPEERYVRNQIVKERPDVVINVVDAGNLERNLFLTTQLIDMNVRMVIALNMYDELEAKGDTFNYEALGAMIGVPMIPTVSPKMRGIRELFDTVIRVYEGVDYVDADGNLVEKAEGDELLDKHYHDLKLPHKHASKDKGSHTNLILPDAVMQRIRHIHINYGTLIESGIRRVKETLQRMDVQMDDYTPRYLAIKLIEGDEEILLHTEQILSHTENAVASPAEETLSLTDDYLHTECTENTETTSLRLSDNGIINDFEQSEKSNFRELRGFCERNKNSVSKENNSVRENSKLSTLNSQLSEIRGEIWDEFKDTAENVINDAKYGFIAGALKETYVARVKEGGKTTTDKIDNVVTSKWLGYPIFLLALFVTFQATFSVGAYPMEWIDAGVAWVADWVRCMLPEGMLNDLLVDGIISGVGGVLVFLPNILILYFFISLMESSGYMARAAFIMDKLMHHIGLHGRSFIPLFMGFGCNVPAIMATRTIENRNARMITILIIPLMSCSARLPIFLLLAGTFFPLRAGVALFAMYMIGVALAAVMAVVFRRVLFNKEETPFVMELPPYRMPSVKTMVRDTWEKGVQYLRKIGTTILVGSIVIWALSYFGPDYRLQSTDNRVEMENSYLGQIGKAVQPVLEPLGFDWKTSVALVTGVTAKEIVVSTLGVLYSVDDVEDTGSLSKRLLCAKDETGEPLYDAAVAISLMLFVLIYLPCIGTLATIKSETGSWWWAGFVALYTIVLAWVVSFVVYQSIIHNVWQEVLVGFILVVTVVNILVRLIGKFRKSSSPCNGCSSAGGCEGCPHSR